MEDEAAAWPNAKMFLPSLDWMVVRMKVPFRISALLLAGLLAASGTLVSSCGAGSATKSTSTLVRPIFSKALDKLGTVVKSSPNEIDDLVLARKDIDNISTSTWTTKEKALSLPVFQEYNVNLARVALSQADTAVLAARTQARTNASATVATTSMVENEPRFMDDLIQATEEVVEEQACSMIFDMIAPAEKPAEKGKDADSGVGVVAAVTKKLSARWQPASLTKAVAWVDYVAGVEKDAKQFADAVSANPTSYSFLGKPSMAQITVAYLRACYATPKAIFP
ncbi:hypothetical protein [Arthrobacter sp. E3]|uniref:hypothetical protein n=1 Tax=Arthrobacter sp. E3 TaxID=517402 RepID=UPI001A93BA02|nr:hypothetical protein [Arthrobacter sp. E3]